MHSLRSAARSLLKAPGFTLTAVLTLGLGLGITTTIFSAVYATLIEPLPFPDSERLVVVHTMVKRDQWEHRGTSIPDFLDYRREATGGFAALSAQAGGADYTLTGDGEPLPVTGEIVSHDYFSTLGIQPALGRAFTAAEDSVPDRDQVVVLADSLWRSRYAADPAVLGRQIMLSDRPHTIVGVMPAGFRGLSNGTQFWLPLALSGAQPWQNRATRWHEMIGRLKPGVTFEQARAELESIGARLASAYPDSNTNYAAAPVRLRDEFYGDLRRPLLVLMGAVGLVLAIACTNVANLLLVRLAARRREIAVRLALGASRGQLSSLFLAESGLLAAVGGLFALLLSSWLTGALSAFNPIELPYFTALELSGPAFGFGLAATAVCAFAIGAFPALLAGRTGLDGALKDAGRGQASGAASGRARALLVFGEIALSLALLVTAALLVRSFFNLVRQQPGYRTEQVASLRVTLPQQRYNRDAARLFGARLRDHAVTLPGVNSAALASDTPLDGNTFSRIASVEGGAAVPAENETRIYTHSVSPEFFATAGIDLLQGRTFESDYAPDAPLAVIVSESFVRRFWPDGGAIGKRIKLARVTASSPWLEIVGVAADTKYRGLVRNPTNDPDIYVPFSQRPEWSFTLLLHTKGASASLLADLRGLVRTFDPNLATLDPITIEDRLTRASSSQRFSALLMGTFAVTALLLAAIGLYGVMSFAVGQRTREIGMRIALGARPADIYRLILGGAGRLLLAGLAAGVLLCLFTAPLIEGLLFELRARDPLTYVGVALLLAAVALLAAWRPARRATRVDPMVALRSE